MSTLPHEVGSIVFDPTQEDAANALSAYRSEPEIVFTDLSGVEKTVGQIRSIITTDFGDCRFPAEAIQAVISSSRQVQTSLGNIAKEHVNIGGHLANIATVFLNAAIEQYGDTPSVVQRALELLYKYVERVHGMRHRSARNYIKAYRRFQDNPIAQSCLTHADAEFLSRKNLPPEVVDAVVNAKSAALDAGQSMPFKEVKALTEQLIKTRALLSEAVVTNEDLQERLADTADKLSNEQIDNKHLSEANTKLQGEVRTMQDLVAHATEDARRQVAHVNALRTDNENLIAERATAAAALQKALSTPRIEYRDSEASSREIEALGTQVAELDSQIDAKRHELENATKMLKKANELVEEKQKKNLIDGKITEVVDLFGTFHATYTSAQLLIAGGGYLKEYRPSLEAIADKMRQFLSEVDAAVARTKV